MEKWKNNKLKDRIKLKSEMIYGFHAVSEALEAGRTFEKIFIQKGIAEDKAKTISKLAREMAIPVSRVPIEKINRFTRKSHQGILGIVSPIEYQSLEMLIPQIYEKGESPFLLLLDEITDVRNFGAIARTADAMGVHGIVIPLKRSANVNEDAIKTSAGVLNYLPVCRVHSIKEAVSLIKDSGIKLLACTEKGTSTLQELEIKKPIAVVMGSEEQGIHPNLIENCDYSVKIDMKGKVSSLNVSVAAGIILHQFS